jgi:glutamyl-tRNA reductase
VARGCAGRRAPLLILDLAETTSVEELAGLLPAVCLYTPDDLRRILSAARATSSSEHRFSLYTIPPQ